ncbi:MAG: hypothetical protein ABH864_06570, partial [archaeon]
KNITFTLYNSTSEENSTTFTDGTRTINWTGLSDGAYTYNVTVYDYSGLYNYTSTRTITLDGSPPTVDFVSPTATSGTNLSQTYIVYNISSVDAIGISLISVFLFNSTYDQINTSMSATSPLFGNFSGLGGGVYYMNASANDTSGNNNYSSETITYILDTTNPNVSLNTPINYTSTTATAMNFTFNLTEANSVANCSLILDYAVVQSLTSVGNNGTYGIYYSSLTVGEHNWSINCTDTAGNVGSGETWVLTVTAAEEEEEEESTPSSSGGGNYYPMYRASEQSLGSEGGYLIKAMKGWKIKLSGLDSTGDHQVEIKKVDSNSVFVTISSDPLDLTIDVGEEKLVDVDGDGKSYDLSVNLVSIKGFFAELVFKKISVPISEEIPDEKENEEEDIVEAPKLNPEDSAQGVVSGEEGEGSARSFIWAVVGILVLGVAGAAVYLARHNRKVKKA